MNQSSPEEMKKVEMKDLWPGDYVFDIGVSPDGGADDLGPMDTYGQAVQAVSMMVRQPDTN